MNDYQLQKIVAHIAALDDFRRGLDGLGLSSDQIEAFKTDELQDLIFSEIFGCVFYETWHSKINFEWYDRGRWEKPRAMDLTNLRKFKEEIVEQIRVLEDPDDMTKFCGEDSRISQPFSDENHTYATNGKILVRAPLIEEFRQNKNEQLTRTCCGLLAPLGEIKPSDFEIVFNEERCGFQESYKPVLIGNKEVAAWLIELIYKLDRLRLASWYGGPCDPLFFISENRIGVVMPLKTNSSEEGQFPIQTA